MSSNAFEKLEGPKARKFIERLNKSWTGSPFDQDRTVVHTRSLGFADKWILADASDTTTVPEKKCVALDDGQSCVPVEFNVDFIPAFANQNGVILSNDGAPDYLRFWLEYVRLGSERFLLVEAIDDMPWREDPTPQARKSLAKSIMPLTLVSTTLDGFVFKACLLFRDTLFDCQIKVEKGGKVTITARNPIAEGLTVADALTGF